MGIYNRNINMLIFLYSRVIVNYTFKVNRLRHLLTGNVDTALFITYLGVFSTCDVVIFEQITMDGWMDRSCNWMNEWMPVVCRADNDPWPIWPTPRPWHESITTTHESWWVHDYIAFSSLRLCAIWTSGFRLFSEYFYSIYSKSSTVVYSPHDIVTSRTRWTVL